MKQKIVLLGGAFNPPTKAHIKLAEIAKDQIKADLVLLIPSKCSYLKEWKKYEKSQILPDKIRLALVKTLETDWLKVDTCEIENITSGKTYDTIKYIKSKYQNSDIYFAIGSDKLEELSRWYRIKDILSDTHFLVMKRNNDKIEDVIKKNLMLSEFSESFIICNKENEEYLEYSSSKVRGYLKNKKFELVRAMVPESVWNELASYINICDTKIKRK